MDEPAMSVILIDMHGDLLQTLRALRAQGPPEQVEVVLVTPDGEAAERYGDDLRAFGAVQVLDSTEAPTTSAALGRGVRASHSALIAYCEDHVFPEPGWVSARLDAHAAGAVAVGGVLRNANPSSATSWAAFLQSFGPFAVPVAGGPSTQLPWHQCSYRRDVLPMGPELEPLLETEGLLHADLVRDGHQLMLESGAAAGHLNVSRPRSHLTASWNGGRVWGAARATHGRWSRARCALGVARAPIVAGFELRSRLADLHRLQPPQPRRVTTLLAAGILVHAFGEIVGVLFGDRGATARRADLELNRRAHLNATDLRQP